MHVQFWGAARTVTGSMHLLVVGGKKVLLDCGMYQGNRREAFERNRDFPFDCAEIDAVVLSHAHIDHSGNLPTLVRNGFCGTIFSTTVTRELASLMLLDSAGIQETDNEYLNKKREQLGKEPLPPLYVTEDAIRTMSQFHALGFDHWFDVVPGVRCRFHVAGHMLGAAIVELVLTENDHRVNLVFSGDLGRPARPLLRDPVTVSDAQYVIMEATYGDRLHPDEDNCDETLVRLIERAQKLNSKLIIPAFSVGRTQEIIYRLGGLIESKRLEPIKVFVDSPMAVDATTIFRANMDAMDDDFARRMRTEPDGDPLYFKDLFFVRKAEHSKKLNDFHEPCVIISASGMCETGRIVHHLRNNIENPDNAILFSGYQAPNTTGRHILDGNPTVRLFGEMFDVRAKIEKLESVSGHADQGELIDWVGEICRQGNVQQIALVHCETEPATVLKEKLGEAGMPEVLIPSRGHIMHLEPLR
ncbi:MAG: MBL fold metallo-hydrolase [Pirellulaceae bacterium]|nr:MBL fold metallo-hydrolase [Pirellulaceae bacterium]